MDTTKRMEESLLPIGLKLIDEIIHNPGLTTNPNFVAQLVGNSLVAAYKAGGIDFSEFIKERV